jgi:hypothetical protein
MTPGITPIYAATRSALLDALDALAGQHPALILVGAQAIFLHTGEVDEAIVMPRPACKLIDALAGKRAGYQRVDEQLSRDPCTDDLKGRRAARRVVKSIATSVRSVS